MSAAVETAKATHTPWRVEDCVLPLDSKLHRSLTPDDLRAIARDPEWQAAELALCRLDPWYWRINYVVTVNEHWVHDGWASPYRRWPSTEAERSYCHLLFVERKTAWPKSRQQRATWRTSSQMYGDASHTGGRLYMIQSKRELDAQKVLERVKGIDSRLRKIAPWMVPDLIRGDVTQLQWANGSTMMAVPEGANYVQSHTPAWWFADEDQLQADAEHAFHAALPACERITLVGTADYGWFYQEFLADVKEVA